MFLCLQYIWIWIISNYCEFLPTDLLWHQPCHWVTGSWWRSSFHGHKPSNRRRTSMATIHRSLGNLNTVDRMVVRKIRAVTLEKTWKNWCFQNLCTGQRWQMDLDLTLGGTRLETRVRCKTTPSRSIERTSDAAKNGGNSALLYAIPWTQWIWGKQAMTSWLAEKLSAWDTKRGKRK